MGYMEIPRLRLARAVEHISEFCLEADTYLKTNPFGAVTEFYTEDGKEHVRLLAKVYQEPPKRLGIIAGDCVHNLRAILDNIIWSLGKAYPTTDPAAKPEKLSFPVCKRLVDYQEILRKPSHKAINDFPAAAKSLIERMQPYNTESLSAHFLNLLNELWNADKHRSPDLMGGTNHSVALEGFNLQQPASMSAGFAVRDGLVFAHGVVPVGGIKPEAKVKLEVDVAFHIQGSAKGHIARDLLGHLYMFVRDDVIAKFEPVFP